MDFDRLEKKLSQEKTKLIGDDRFITGHYYIEATYDIKKVVEKVASHQSTASSVYDSQSLLGRCSGKVSNVRYHDKSKKKGLAAISFPVEMFGRRVNSADILHILSGAVQNDEAQHKIFYLMDIEIPEGVLATFPGPKYGTNIFHNLKKPVIGTIIKPCSGINLKDYERIVSNLVSLERLDFIKEDENLFPDFKHCPLEKRVKIAQKIIKKSGRDIIFAPHISSNPLGFFDNLKLVARAGLRAVMFSESYYGGLLRDARDFIEKNKLGLFVYAHNGAICVKTKNINRVLLDYLARLDGADFRQTAPFGENCYLRPLPWQRGLVENVLTKEISGFKKTICVRAGGLDQGNLLQNLYDCEKKFENYLFLMGSAINSIKNEKGKTDPKIAITAIKDLVNLHRNGVNISNTNSLYKYGLENNLPDLITCLKQRYGI